MNAFGKFSNAITFWMHSLSHTAHSTPHQITASASVNAVVWEHEENDIIMARKFFCCCCCCCFSSFIAILSHSFCSIQRKLQRRCHCCCCWCCCQKQTAFLFIYHYHYHHPANNKWILAKPDNVQWQQHHTIKLKPLESFAFRRRADRKIEKKGKNTHAAHNFNIH